MDASRDSLPCPVSTRVNRFHAPSLPPSCLVLEYKLGYHVTNVQLIKAGLEAVDSEVEPLGVPYRVDVVL